MNQQTTATAAKDESSASPPTAPAVVLVGLNGFGRQHLANIERLAGEEKIRFLAGIDPKDPGGPGSRGKHANLQHLRRVP
ncbi:hypothetical protein AAHB37_00260 [Glutamicibacter halophytocola]|uniref:hypothetical protein n=1 Tax=Glutamicibacter halophytocola TaxID=1933880 RepID=UPI00321BDE2F